MVAAVVPDCLVSIEVIEISLHEEIGRLVRIGVFLKFSSGISG